MSRHVDRWKTQPATSNPSDKRPVGRGAKTAMRTTLRVLRTGQISRHTTLLLALCVLVSLATAALGSASSAAVPAKPTLTVGGSFICIGLGVDNVLFDFVYEPLIKQDPAGTFRPG